MKTDPQLQVQPTGKLFLRLTIFGSFLIGCVYVFLLLFNTALKAIL